MTMINNSSFNKIFDMLEAAMLTAPAITVTKPQVDTPKVFSDSTDGLHLPSYLSLVPSEGLNPDYEVPTKKKNNKFPQDLTNQRLEWQVKHGLKFFHLSRIPGVCPSYDEEGSYGTDTPLTVAYARANPEVTHGTIYHISVALCNPQDNFDRKAGAYYAAKKFNDGHYIEMKKRPDERIESALMRMFMDM